MENFLTFVIKKRKLIYALCCCLVVAVVLGRVIGAAGRKQEVREIPIRTVKTYELHAVEGARIRTFPGEVRASEQVDLAFRVPGTLHELPISRGQQMKRGDLIAALDKRDYESTLAQVKSELKSQEAALASMRTGRREDVSAYSAQLSAAKVRLDEAKLSLDRYTSLLSSGVVSKADYDRVKAEHDVARENVRVAEQNLVKSRAGARTEDIDMQNARIAGLRAQVKAAEDALKDTELRAPFDGTIAEKFVDNYQSVQKDQKVVGLQDISGLEVVFSVPAKFMMEVNPNSDNTRSPAEVTGNLSIQAKFAALPDMLLPLHFKEVTTRGNVQAQTYDAVFVLENPDHRVILPGMGVDVLVGLPKMPDNGNGHTGFPVSASMLEAGSGEMHYVWKVAEENGRWRVHKTEVTLHGYIGEKAIVSGDLREGDRIVAAGFSYLSEGEEVRLYVSPENRRKEQ